MKKFALFCGIIFLWAYFACVASSTFTSSLTMTGSPPSVSAVTLNNGLTITLTPATTTNISVAATIGDINGCTDLAGGTTTVLLYRSGITSSTCLTSPNALNCYIATAFTASSTCNSPQISINATTTFAMQYYAQATDSSSSFAGQNWMATVIFTDLNGVTASGDSINASTTDDVATVVALNLPTTTINYGLLNASTTTSSTNQSVNVQDAGNSNITVQVNGTALAFGGNTIATSSQHYATSSFTFGGGETLLSDTATTITGMTINASGTAGGGGGAGGLSTNWTSTQALPYSDSGLGSVAYNGYIYTIAGGANGAITSTVLFAPINSNGSIGAWTSTTALPYPDYIHTSVAYSGYLYTIGGQTNATTTNYTSTVLFAPINSTGSIGAWTSTTALPYPLHYHTSVAYSGYLYAIGGFIDSSTETSTVLFAPINSTGSIGAWTSTTALPYELVYHTSVAYSGYLYTIGGLSFISVTSTVLFAPINSTGSIGAWTSTTALPYTNYTHASVAYNGNLYTIGGIGGPLATSTVIFAPINATGSIGNWSSTQVLPFAISSQSSVAYNNYLYTIGGIANGGSVTSTVLFAPFNTAAGATTTYWGWGVPNGTPRGNYMGTITFTAVYSP